jgi:hypothetical protein
MKRIITIALVVSLSGCDNSAKQDADIALMQTNIQVLQDQNAVLKGNISDLESRVDAIESSNKDQATVNNNLADLAVAAIPKKERAEEGSWIAWRSMFYNGPALMRVPEPKPMSAYSTQSECGAALVANVDANGGDKNTLTYVTQAPVGGIFTYTLSCLPKGVDPR